jgi:hypothetical protein
MANIHFFPANRQRGAASLAIAVVLLLIITAALVASQRLASSVTMDASASDLRVQSLFLAESGLERANQQFIAGITCSAASNGTLTMAGKGTVALSYLGATDFDGTACNGANCAKSSCRVQATGSAAGSTGAPALNARTLETSFVQKSGNTSTQTALSAVTVNGKPNFRLTNTVAAGTSRLYVLTILWTTVTDNSPPSKFKPGNVTGVKYCGNTSGAGTPMLTPFTPNPKVIDSTSTLNGYGVQVYYLVAPPVGTCDVYIAFDADPDGVAVGYINVNGADQTTPLASADWVSYATPVATFSKAVTVPANGLALDILSRNNGGSPVTLGCNSLTLTVLFSGNYNRATGESQSCGPGSTASTAVTMGYSTNVAKAAAYAVVTLKADTSSGGGARVRFPGGGQAKWHEVIVPPTP